MALLIEGHHDNRSAVTPDDGSFSQELLLAVLKADAVDNRFALHVLQACEQDIPLGRIDHHRYGRDDRIACDKPQVPGHRLDAIEQRIVHVDVDDRRAVLDLLSGYFHGLFKLVVANQIRKGLRTCHVGPFPNHRKPGFWPQCGGFLTAQPRPDNRLRGYSRWDISNSLRDRSNVIRCRTAATSDDVQPTVSSEILDVVGHSRRCKVVLSKRIGKSGVGVA